MSTEHDKLQLKVLRSQLRYFRLRNVLTFLGISTVVTTLIVVLLIYFNVNDVANDTRANTQTLINCTTPGHQCYEQGRSATSGAVGTIAKVVVAASFCEKNLVHGSTQDQIQKCVNATLGVQ